MATRPTPKCHFVSRFPKLKVLQLWRPIILCADLWSRWGLQQSCSLFQELSNGTWHATYTKKGKAILVVKNQIGNLIRDPSFSHDLCFNYQNGSCEPILNIYIPRALPWYKELFNPMGFDPCNHSIKIRNPPGLQLPKWELTWECEGSFPHTLLHCWEHEMWFLGFLLGPHLYKPLPWLQTQG